jgi:malonyl-CoA O-methyltransferase
MQWLRSLLPKQRRMADLNEIRKSFEEGASDEEHFPSSIDPRIYHVKLLLDHLGSSRGVLDVGCGKGRFARIVRQHNPDARVVCFDLALNMLKCVDPGLLPCAGSMTALPFAAASFDGVYATESLEHAVDIETAVAEMTRVLRPGGRLVIIDKNAEHWGKLATPAWEKWFHRRELEKLLARHCSKVESRLISYWEDVPPDGLFIAWLGEK